MIKEFQKIIKDQNFSKSIVDQKKLSTFALSFLKLFIDDMSTPM